MEDNMEYPEEIYRNRDGGSLAPEVRSSIYNLAWGRQHAYRVGFEAGKAEQADPLEVYSNLTAAIKAGEPIDWERLDGKRVQCAKPEVGTLHGTLNRDESCSPDDFYGWWDDDKTDLVYTRALRHAWGGFYGWSLWVEGDIPLRRKTADQLKVGTYFRGVCISKEEWFMYVGGEPLGDIRTIYYAPEMFKSDAAASEWVVLEEYGPFQKPEGK